MKTAIIIFIILVLALGGLFFYLKYTFSQDTGYSNLTISTVHEGKLIRTGIRVGDFRGESVKNAPIKLVVPNSTIKVYNYNLKDQNYYTEIKEVKTDKINNRIRLDLTEPKDLKISHYVNKSSNKINITLESEEYRNVMFCIDWTFNFISLDADYEEVEKPVSYRFFGKCYDPKIERLGKKNIILDYNSLGGLKSNDKISFVFYDNDYINGVLTDYFEGDIGGENLEYEIKF